MKKYLKILIIICTLLYLPAFAEPVRKLSWEDLVPAHLLSDDPLADLTQEQLDLVVWVVNTLDSLPPRGSGAAAERPNWRKTGRLRPLFELCLSG